MCQKPITGTTETLIPEEIRQLLLFAVAEEGCCPLAPLHRGKYQHSVSPAKSIIANSQNLLYLGGHQLEKQSEVLLGELRSELKEARELCYCRERSRLYPVSTSQGQPAQARARPRISRPTKIPNLQTISSKLTLRLRAISYTAKKKKIIIIK